MGSKYLAVFGFVLKFAWFQGLFVIYMTKELQFGMGKEMILIFVVVFGLTTCTKIDEERVVFNECQPEFEEQLSSFPADKNIYKSTLDSNETIRFESKYLVLDQYSELVANIDSLATDTSIHVENVRDTNDLKRCFGGKLVKVRILHDSLFAKLRTSDTLFEIAHQNVLKKHRGNLYLNKLQANSWWLTTRLLYRNDCIIFQHINPSDSLMKYSFVEKEQTDSDKPIYKLSPDRKGFKKLQKDGLYVASACFCK